MRPTYWVFLAVFIGVTFHGRPTFAGVKESQIPYGLAGPGLEFDTPCQSRIAYFKKNTAKVDPDFVRLIQFTLAKGALKECPELFVAITGQANISETTHYGLALAKRRSLAIERLFIKAGVPKDRLIVRWIDDKGAEDRTDVGQALMQKVEIDFWRSKNFP